MKIKGILESIDSMKTKMHVAYRIFHCSPQIKRAIKQWKDEEDLPVVEICLETSEDNYVTIKSYDLVNKYGFDDLAALLMLDDLMKAHAKKDYERLNQLLSFLEYGKHEPINPKAVDEILGQVQQNNPKVWAEYQKICAEEEVRENKLKDEYSRIIETEL